MKRTWKAMLPMLYDIARYKVEDVAEKAKNVLDYKLDEAKDKAREIFADFVEDYQRTGSISKVIALRMDKEAIKGLEFEFLPWIEDEEEKLNELENIAQMINSSESTYVDPYENEKKTTFH